MAQFLNTQEIMATTSRILRRAQRRIVVISPYLQLSDTWLERFHDAADRNVPVAVVFGKSDNWAEESKLRSVETVSVFFLQNLHAKMYLSESEALVGSMNLYEASERNREAGVLLTADADAEAFREAWQEATSIINASERLRFFGQEEETGYCIRCGDHGLSRDRFFPLCPDCYESWAEWGNEDYRESYCHACGTSSAVSKRRPFCERCYEETL